MLLRAHRKARDCNIQEKVHLVCASAMEIPYANESFDLVTCALATHPMDVQHLLPETYRVLSPDGMLSMADVGGSNLWQSPAVKFFHKIFAFVYCLMKENSSRDWAEADPISNVRSPDEWSALLLLTGFRDIKITKLNSKHRWIPGPLVIRAIKPKIGGLA